MSLLPITLYSYAKGANPWKVAIILEELEIPYQTHFFKDLGEVKEVSFLAKNINGRVPAIEDPNTNLTLWESGAIIEYLVDTYDKEHKLFFGDEMQSKHLLKQWLYFQTSGQGPYFGQCARFVHYFDEILPSVIERYSNEIKRVVHVLDAHLASKNADYLVGDKATYADLAFVPYNTLIPFLLNDAEEADKLFNDHPHFKAWHHRLMGRPAVAKIEHDKQEAIKALTA